MTIRDVLPRMLGMVAAGLVVVGPPAASRAGVPVAPTDPREIVAIGDRVVFSARDTRHGRELWVSDGTAHGTYRLTDLRRGRASAGPTMLTDLGRRVAFTTWSRSSGSSILVTDGTRRGTRRTPVPATILREGLLRMSALGRRLLVETSRGWWITDHTGGGARRVAPRGPIVTLQRSTLTIAETMCCPGSARLLTWSVSAARARRVAELDHVLIDEFPPWMVAHGGRAWFSGFDGEGARVLWVTDGTAAGTRPLTARRAGEWPTHLAPTADGGLLFVARDPAHGTELWRSDGSVTGTALLADLTTTPRSRWSVARIGFLRFAILRGPGGRIRRVAFAPSTEGSSVAWVAPFGDRALVMVASLVGDEPARLLSVDGMSGSAFTLVDGIQPGDQCDADDSPLGYTAPVRFGDRMLFAAGMTGGPAELWITDGTPDGTRTVVSSGSLRPRDPCGLVRAAARVFFTAPGSDGRRTLWVTDGTGPGTRPVAGPE